MLHIYIRGSLGLIWLVAAIVCGDIGELSDDGALHGFSRRLPVFHICGMEKRKGRQRGEVRWEKRS